MVPVICENTPKVHELYSQLHTLTISPRNTISDYNSARLSICSQAEEISDDSFNDDDFKLPREEL